MQIVLGGGGGGPPPEGSLGGPPRTFCSACCTCSLSLASFSEKSFLFSSIYTTIHQRGKKGWKWKGRYSLREAFDLLLQSRNLLFRVEQLQ